jgi:hypothetical protein
MMAWIPIVGDCRIDRECRMTVPGEAGHRLVEADGRS